MLLDAVLDDRDFVWLGPSMDKRRHFVRHLTDRLDRREYPHLLFGDGPAKTARYFPDKLPIGMQPYGEPHVFVYLVTQPVTDGLPDVPPAALRPAPCAAPMDGPAAVPPAAREGEDWPICTPRGSTWRHRWSRRTSRRWSGFSPNGSGSPSRALDLPTSAISRCRAPIAHRDSERCTGSGWTIPRTLFGWPDHASLPTTSTAATGRSNALICHGSTFTSLLWSTSPDSHS